MVKFEEVKPGDLLIEPVGNYVLANSVVIGLLPSTFPRQQVISSFTHIKPPYLLYRLEYNDSIGLFMPLTFEKWVKEAQYQHSPRNSVYKLDESLLKSALDYLMSPIHSAPSLVSRGIPSNEVAGQVVEIIDNLLKEF